MNASDVADEPLVLPSAPPPAEAPRLPVAAAAVPMVSGIVLFVSTGSALSLCLAALGPLMVLLAFLAGRSRRRKDRRRQAAEADAAWTRVEAEHAERAERALSALRRSAPDVAALLAGRTPRAPSVPPEARLVLGGGSVPHPVRTSGGEGERAREFRAAHRLLHGAPLTVPLAGGVLLRGPGAVVDGAARALVLQICLRFAATAVQLEGDLLERLGLDRLPQARSRAGRDPWRVHVGSGETPPVAADTRILLATAEAPVPEGVDTVLDAPDPRRAILRIDGAEERCAVEALSWDQGRAVAGMIEEQAEDVPEIPQTLGFDRLSHPVGPSPGLPAVLGEDEHGAVVVDLVEDGPHALVAGVTGAGKSELLVTWITALAAAHPPERVSFVLADFKGGTAFDGLRALPHVAAVVTDLDGAGAERGVLSMRAELRRREGLLAARGARSVADAPDAMPRLVLVVDEFAALLNEHPELSAVFTDIAARGRALGMHLVLGTQRASGAIRDTLAANCPLRISLRATDAADSRLLLGTDEAVRLPGDAAGRGLALVRRPRDAAPVRFRVALTRPSDIVGIADRGGARAISPWLPALPERIDLDGLQQASADLGRGGRRGRAGILLALADDPAAQTRTVLVARRGIDRGLAVFGGPGSGKSTVLHGLRAQVPGAVALSIDPEQAWAQLDALEGGRQGPPPALLCDDLDVLLAAYPADYAAVVVARLQRIVRGAEERGVLVALAASRSSGGVAAIADLLPRRAVLRMPGKTEHLAVGGDAAAFDPCRPPGRARFDGVEAQFADVSPDGKGSASGPDLRWSPRRPVVAVVATSPITTAQAMAVCAPEATIRLVQAGEDEPGEAGPVILVGDEDTWQRRFALWQRLRSEAEIVVVAEAARELRTLAGVRELPPYARSHAERIWTLLPGGRPELRVLTRSPAAPRREPPPHPGLRARRRQEDQTRTSASGTSGRS